MGLLPLGVDVTMRRIALSSKDIAAVRAGQLRSMRRRFTAPAWWEGHRIGYKVYPFGPSTHGLYAETICARDGGQQRRNPYGEPGALLHPRGTSITLEIVSVELAGDERDERRAARAWVVEFRRVDTARRPRSMAKAYNDLPAKARAVMVEHAVRSRAAHFAALDVKEGDVLTPAAPGDQSFTLTVLAPLDGGTAWGRIDFGGGDIREGHYDIDRHRGRLYGGPCWKRVGHDAGAAA